MAASRLPAPGTEYGPCEGECVHVDCASSRRKAQAQCRYCGEEIGYEVRIYSDPENFERVIHAVCLEVLIDREREMMR